MARPDPLTAGDALRRGGVSAGLEVVLRQVHAQGIGVGPVRRVPSRQVARGVEVIRHISRLGLSHLPVRRKTRVCLAR